MTLMSNQVREDFGMAISGDRIFAFGGRRDPRGLVHKALPVGDMLMFSLRNFTWTPLCKEGSADCSSVSECSMMFEQQCH